MSITYGFYNAIGGDRKYDATQMSSLFDGIINDGVFMSVGEALVVSIASGMNVLVGPGRAWFDHTWTSNDAPLVLTVEQSDVVLHRIDVVVLEVNANDEVRANTIKLIKGTPSSVPVAPTLITTNLVNQHPLCHIYVGKGVTTLIPANITNLVGSSTCPFVTGILETLDLDALLVQWRGEVDALFIQRNVDINALIAQWDGDIDTWFATIQGMLSGDIAVTLANQIITHEADTVSHGVMHDPTLNSNYMWKVDNGQVYIEEVS